MGFSFKACKELSVNVESLFHDIYYYMEKSTNRMHAFIHCQEEAGVDITKVCKQEYLVLWGRIGLTSVAVWKLRH